MSHFFNFQFRQTVNQDVQKLMTFSQLLSSMRFAISMLSFVALASIIGTVLKQNESYESYIIKFGQFWFDFFEVLGLYNVYQASWFIIILIFLIASTSLCIYRNAPQVMRDIKEFNVKIKEESLRNMKYSSQINMPKNALDNCQQVLIDNGFKVKLTNKDSAVLLSAKKGQFQKMGYFFTHISIIIISIGGLMDGNLVFKAQEHFGVKSIETEDLPLSKIPKTSWLESSNFSYRANMLLKEGEIQSVAFLPRKDGYLVQDLPFTVALKDFEIKHYSSGQPKSFESDLLIKNKETGETVRKIISVNKPLTYKGITLYQSDFQDGGSKLKINLWDLQTKSSSEEMKSEVFKINPITHSGKKLLFEFEDFRLFNILDIEMNGEKVSKNVGPNFTYKVRNESGQAVEYQNFQFPMRVNGAQYFMSGMRVSQQEDFRYLKIPADANNSLQGFMIFKNLLFSSVKTNEAIDRIIKDTSENSTNDPQAFKLSLEKVIQMFISGGYSAVAQSIEQNIPAEKQTEIANTYIKIIFLIANNLVELYKQDNPDDDLYEIDDLQKFIQDALNTLSDRFFYGHDFYLELVDFEHIQASGLQLTKAPGQFWVYLGSLFLVLGIFCMIYIQEIRLWIFKKNNSNKATLAMSTNREHLDFKTIFDDLLEKLNNKV